MSLFGQNSPIHKEISAHSSRMICYHLEKAMGVQKWRFLQKSKECHVTMAAQLGYT